MIRFLEGRSKCLRCSTAMWLFSKITKELHLRDISLVGSSITWTNGLNNSSSSRLDQFLVSKERGTTSVA